MERKTMATGRTKSIERLLAHVPTPKEIVAYLDERVIGQDEAKRRLAVAVYNHYKRIYATRSEVILSSRFRNAEFSDVELDKSNVMLLGETGTGKTMLVQQIAQMMGVPCYIQDCTKLTAAGYVGEDVENCLTGLLKQCGYNVELAQIGIVCLDEVDKIAKKGENVSITRDVSGECVQQALLKIVEGNDVGVMPEGGRKHPEQPLIKVNTSNILFIAMGAFVGLDKIVESRMAEGSAKIGFSRKSPASDTEQCAKFMGGITPMDLKKFGMIPEFVGRFPVITSTKALTRDDLLRIITEPKNSILRQYQKLFSLDGKSLIFDDASLGIVADLAIETHTGARGLRLIMENILNDLMFESADSRKKKIVVTADYVSDRLGLMSA